MNRARGFTLVELLAVIAIMLVLMAATFGAFSVFAERAGPDAILSTIQSYINTARDYASSSGLTTRVFFSADTNRPMDGTTIKVRYLPVGVTGTQDSDWVDVAGMKPMTLQEGVYVLKDIRGALPTPTLSASTSVVGYIPTVTDIQNGRNDEQKLRDFLKTYAYGASGNTLQQMHQGFFIEVDPSGYLSLNPLSTSGNTGINTSVTNGVIVVKMVAGNVTGYAFYPLNANTGTRLVFE
jgi:prepilin-type N-terminal cleavage/methylation domain-containing protein